MDEDRPPPSGSSIGGAPPDKGGYEDTLNNSANDGASSSSSAAAAAAATNEASATGDVADEPQALFDLNSGAAVVFAAVMILLHLFKGKFGFGCHFKLAKLPPVRCGGVWGKGRREERFLLSFGRGRRLGSLSLFSLLTSFFSLLSKIP